MRAREARVPHRLVAVLLRRVVPQRRGLELRRRSVGHRRGLLGTRPRLKRTRAAYDPPCRTERFAIPSTPRRRERLARADAPEGAARASAIVLLAHGAGARWTPLHGGAWRAGLAARGFPVLRFNYPYCERARARDAQRPPDRAPVLEAAHAAALAALERARRRPALAARGQVARRAHRDAPRGQGRALRRAGALRLPAAPARPAGATAHRALPGHRPARALPAGHARRASATSSSCARRSRRYGGNATLEVIEGADHGFHVPRKSGRTDEEVREELLERVRPGSSTSSGLSRRSAGAQPALEGVEGVVAARGTARTSSAASRAPPGSSTARR